MRRMGFAAPLLLAAMMGAPFAPLTAHAEQATTATRSAAAERPDVDRGKLLDAVVDAVERQFVDAEMLRRLDWRARAEEVRPAVMTAATLAEAVRSINALLAQLKTSHTALYTQDDYEHAILLDIVGGAGGTAEFIADSFWGVGPYYPGIGVFTRKIGDRHFIDGVMEGSPGEKAGLLFGDEILSVDGEPYSPVAAFRGKIGRTVSLETRRDRDAPTRTLSAAVIPIRPSATFAAAAKASARVIERNGRRIGYIHIWSSNEARSLQSALAELEPAEGGRRRSDRSAKDERPSLDFLIVDMRGRVGGNTVSAEQMLETLDNARKPYWGPWRSISRSGPERMRGSAQGGAPSPAYSFRGRAALLIDERTRSAGELLAYGFKRSGFGPVIGTTTAGAVSSGATVLMPGGLLLYVAVAGLEMDGRPIEGVGVEPDRIVARPLPYAAGADAVLDAALDAFAGSAP